MYYFYYFVRIFREIFGRRALKKVLIIGIVAVVIMLLLKNNTFAFSGLEGDDTYTDPNNSIFQVYDGYLNDLAVRLNNSSDEDAEDLLWRLGDGYSFVVYYGTAEYDYSNDFKHMRVVLFNSSVQFQTSTAYSAWHNMDCEYVYNVSNNGLIYDFTDLDCTRSNLTRTIYTPYILINRYNDMLCEVVKNKTNRDTQNIIGAINTQTQKIEEGNQIAQDTHDFVSDDSIDNNEMNIDTSNAQITDNTGINNFYSTFLSSIETRLTNYDESDVTTITVPLPNNVPDLVLRSDLLSRYISNTAIGNLITVFWTFLFGGYIVNYIMRMIKWLTSGRVFSDGGVSDFIWYLDTNNEIIKGYMM